MAIYIDSDKRIKEIFVNVNGQKKTVSSAWVNRDGVPVRVFRYEQPIKDIGWNYTLDNQDNIIILNYYTGAETDVVVHSSYKINGKSYKTKLSNGNIENNKNGYKPYMFNATSETYNVLKIKSISFENGIDTSDVSDMSYMFAGLEKLINLDMGGIDTSNVTCMKGMFRNSGSPLVNCNLDISGFNTYKVTDMSYMFNGCGFSSLDISSFDTSNVIDMNHMFYDLYSENLTLLDLCHFKTYKVTDMSYMFSSNRYLQKVYVTSNYWYTGGADKTNMFSNCDKVSSVTYK